MKALAPDTREAALDVVNSLLDWEGDTVRLRPGNWGGHWLAVNDTKHEAAVVFTVDYDVEDVDYDEAVDRYFGGGGVK